MINHLPLLSIRVLKLLYIREVKLFLSDLQRDCSTSNIEKRRFKLHAISSEIDGKMKGKSTTISF
ncbi:MAG TPA: hypothetical protein VFQ58_04530 [Flavisolibacter sp.]|jgi:hypothetical protein|nr:hypothetical protein [Flavisolibacter sp.]